MNDQPIPARRIWAGLQLLDRQLRDRNGTLCGKVDDLALALDEETGALTVRAILSGPGRLAGRMGRHRLGDWLVRFARDNAPAGGNDDPTAIPWQVVRETSSVVTLSCDADDVGSFLGERWTRDHLVRHIPGSRHEVE